MSTNNGPQGPVLTIVLTGTGQINVNGPLENKILCLGMLELAKAAVLAFKVGNVVVPTLLPPTDLRAT